jgi:hypothetical protein
MEQAFMPEVKTGGAVFMAEVERVEQAFMPAVKNPKLFGFSR